MGVPRCQGQNVHDFSFENHEIQTDIFSRKVCSTLSSLTIGRLAQLKEEGGNISDQNGFQFHEDWFSIQKVALGLNIIDRIPSQT